MEGTTVHERGLSVQEIVTKARYRRVKAEHRRRHGRQPYDRKGTTVRERQGRLILRARARAREAGMEHSVTWAQIYWPTHCPVLGLELNYMGGGARPGPNAASLDRWDNSKGYVPGNVFVVSLRANAIKSNATSAELAAVLEYAQNGIY